MLTNLLATVVTMLVTNTTEVVTSYDSYVPDWPRQTIDGVSGYTPAIGYQKGVGPNAKQVTTLVEEVTTVRFEFGGKTNEVRQSKVVASETKYYAREWKEVPAPTLHLGVYDGSINWSNALLTTVCTNILFRP